MNPEEKNRKQAEELREEELDGVTGGYGPNGFGAMPGASTMQYQPGMAMGATTMQYQPGANPMQAQTLEQQKGGIPANPVPHAPKKSGGTHSL